MINSPVTGVVITQVPVPVTTIKKPHRPFQGSEADRLFCCFAGRGANIRPCGAVAEGSASTAGRHTEGLPPCVPEWRLLLVELELSELHMVAAMVFADFQAEVLPLTARDTEGILKALFVT